MDAFDSYAAGQEPLPWTVVRDHPTSWLVGNNEMIISYVRFNLIMDAVKQYFQKDSVVLDVGVYPGVMPQIFHEFYPKDTPYTYYGLGLGFDDAFRAKMIDLNVQLLECDLDPRLFLNRNRTTIIPIDKEKVEICIFTDVIEHFYDPFFPLTEINRVCKSGAVLIITTDNLTRYGGVKSMLKGGSCNVRLIRGNLFYEGDWRPHFREYSKGELFQLVEWAGFEVVSHRFYEAEFGLWRAVNGKLLKVAREQYSFVRKLKNLIKKAAVQTVPHFRDNHILVARKRIDYDTMMDSAPKVAADMDQWVSQRKTFN